MKLPVVSGKEIMKLLSKHGFFVARQKGSHVIMKKKLSGRTLVTVVPLHKKIDPGTLLSILEQCEMEKDELQGIYPLRTLKGAVSPRGGQALWLC